MPRAMQSAAIRTGMPLQTATMRSTIVILLCSGRLEVRQTLHVGLAIADFGVAGLAVKAARRRVKIDRGALNLAQGLHALGSCVYERQRVAAPGIVELMMPMDVAKRIEIVIDEAARDIARHRRSQ